MEETLEQLLNELDPRLRAVLPYMLPDRVVARKQLIENFTVPVEELPLDELEEWATPHIQETLGVPEREMGKIMAQLPQEDLSRKNAIIDLYAFCVALILQRQTQVEMYGESSI